MDASPGMPAKRRLDGKGHLLFDLEGESAGAIGVDLHLVVGDVGHGVDGEALERIDPKAASDHKLRKTTRNRRSMANCNTRSSMVCLSYRIEANNA